MAWIDPVINRKSAQSQTTHIDFNRICGNMNHVLNTNLKTNWTVNDIVDEETWLTIVNNAHIYDSNVDISTHYSNLNRIEAVCANLITGRYPGETLYPSQTLYP